MNPVTATQEIPFIAAYICIFSVCLSHVYGSYTGCALLCSVLSGGKKTSIKPSFVTQLKLGVGYKQIL